VWEKIKNGIGCVNMSKYRLDFVSNSSSSSFIVAVKGDAFFGDVKVALKDTIEQHSKGIINDMKCFEKDLLNVDEVIDSVICKLMSIAGGGIKLDDWNAGSQELSNEDEVENCIIFDCFGNVDTDKIKVRGCC
jgi:hypothetical protein